MAIARTVLVVDDHAAFRSLVAEHLPEGLPGVPGSLAAGAGAFVGEPTPVA